MKEQTTATDDALAAREELEELILTGINKTEDLMFNLGLYVRSSLLVKFLVMDDLYKRILNVPGMLVEFGCWYGQSLVLLENLRAIHEPFNKSRRIVGFDSFNGYEDGSYAAGGDYVPKLLNLLRVHERMNAFGHVSAGHELIVGDVAETALTRIRETAIVALALFDLCEGEALDNALGAVRERIVPGSVLLLDGEAEVKAFHRQFWGPHRTEKCALYPSKTIVTFQ